MEIIKNFGLDPVFLAAQVINFLIILYVLKRFLYKPILELLKKREDAIKEGVRKNEEVRILLEKASSEEKAVLKRAEAYAKKIIDDAKSHATETAKEIEEISKKQTEKIFADASLQIKKEAIETEKRLTLTVSKVAIEFLKKSLEQLFSEKEQKEILKKALKEMKI
ncbi:MAG: F0F1 ATP synthase subunit B [Candidatus Levybacteria bacterium]|nr:F0F1 ATP synthase subunit B [Candidatus Levybacteria bacterium]